MKHMIQYQMCNYSYFMSAVLNNSGRHYQNLMNVSAFDTSWFIDVITSWEGLLTNPIYLKFVIEAHIHPVFHLVEYILYLEEYTYINENHQEEFVLAENIGDWYGYLLRRELATFQRILMNGLQIHSKELNSEVWN